MATDLLRIQVPAQDGEASMKGLAPPKDAWETNDTAGTMPEAVGIISLWIGLGVSVAA